MSTYSCISYCNYNCCYGFGCCDQFVNTCGDYYDCQTGGYFYYYALNWWVWFLIALGAIFFFAIVGVIIGCIRRRQRYEADQNTVVVDTQPSYGGNQGYQGGYQGYGQNDTYVGQPVAVEISNQPYRAY